ncbi:CO/xanthine dehydrogenase FAD-binding subunit [Bradyrhizobium sp. i1.4.4]
MYEFKYHRPGTVRQAANLLVKNEDAKVIAGGHTLIPVMKQRLASPPHLVDLSHIEGLNTIEMKGRALVIGATARHAEVASSAIVGEAIPALANLASQIGDPAVRHKGTIGGSLANNDPTADYPAAVLALGATIVTNKRRLKAEEYFQGLFTTALEADEIITKVMFPLPKKAAYIKFRNQASRYAAGRRVRGAASFGRARRRHRCRLRRRVPRHRVRGSPEEALRREGARWHRGAGGRPQQRHPRQRRIPCASHRGADAARPRRRQCQGVSEPHASAQTCPR